MIIITAVGNDRPGMVHAITAELAAAGCNIEDTTMTRLSGEFAMILIVSPPADGTADSLAARLAPLEKSHGLYISCRAMDDDGDLTSDADAERYILSVYGADRKGLVAGISGVLAAHGVNITDMQTRVTTANKTYIMIIEFEVAAGFAVGKLEAAISKVAAEIGVNVTLHPLEEDVM